MGGTWVAQSVECQTLDCSSGHDLMVLESEPHTGVCADSVEPGACFGFDVSLFYLPLPYSRSLSLSQSL